MHLSIQRAKQGQNSLFKSNATNPHEFPALFESCFSRHGSYSTFHFNVISKNKKFIGISINFFHIKIVYAKNFQMFLSHMNRLSSVWSNGCIFRIGVKFKIAFGAKLPGKYSYYNIDVILIRSNEGKLHSIVLC